ncbi:MAG: capsular polysaccharide biosynthesis protein [Cyclobacteriaceae bacterium]|nr:MAG: capsular polysaccharide biosynthesis protein [Cyclobacteriaceae bacterium]
MVDVHSHLIPGIDDGSSSMEESLELIQTMSELGYQKIITTPHVMNDFYPNTTEDIRARLERLKVHVEAAGIDMEIEAAAEYYLDEHMMQMLDDKKELLTFGDNYLLFETSFLNEPAYLREGIFQIISNGMKPVMAHPERYVFVQNRPEILEDLMDRGLLLQINTISLSGYYSKGAKKLAEFLIDQKAISFLGTDCHNKKHLEMMSETVDQKYFDKALQLDLLNNFL